jgi:predicted alpha/beta superfamily hydrolase
MEFEYKLTRGKWDNEAIYEPNVLPQNRKLKVIKDELVKVNIVDWLDMMKFTGGITGLVKYHRAFPGKHLNYKRDIIVLLPASYESASQKRYPVLYMHDGQNIIDPRTSFTKVDWGIDETVAKLVNENKIPELIVVGIYNSPDRVQEYSDSDLGNAYMEFIINELKPFIDTTYRTLPDRQNTTTMGSSMGGLISFLLVWKHSEVFSQAGCLSTWFPFDKGKAYMMVNKYTGPKKNIRIYLDHGDVGMEKEAIASNQKMKNLLLKKGFVLGKDLDYYWAKGTEHNEAAWAQRLSRPVLFLFGKQSPNSQLQTPN